MKSKILVLEEEANFKIFKGVLEPQFEVDYTQSEVFALDRLTRERFWAFFAVLKGTDSLEIVRWAREITPRLFVIVTADHSAMEVTIEAMKSGAYDYLLRPIDKKRLKLIIERAERDHAFDQQPEEKLQQLAILDGLTGIYNHRYFHEMLSREIERAKRYPQEVSLLMADVDNFKMYNDTYGHQAGDTLLKMVAQNIVHQVRQVDLVARYGGEEFGIILPNASKQKAHTLANRVRSSIAQLSLNGEAGFPKGELTISIGLATYPEEAKTKDELIARADKALYKAKAHGKNRVFAFW
ncbi:TPA: hypothetical protein DCX15_03895 [bacterium]|nr:hypothetical protein [bacterium]